MFIWIAAKKFLLGAFYTVATLGVAGTTYQCVSTQLDEYSYPAPGRMIDIGGYRLHIQEAGAEHSGPTVILDAGAGNYSLDWALVQPKIAHSARVVSYDRAGNGWSDESPLPRTSKNMMIELHALLKNAGIPGPYIFVGHSFGGLNAQIYAHLYPDEIAGIILVDSSHEDQEQRLPKPPVDFASPAARIAALIAAYTGVIRLALNFAQQTNHLPADLETIRRKHVCTPKFIRTTFAMMRLFDESNKQLKEYGTALSDIPLTVISAGKPNAIETTGGLYTQEQLDAMFKIWQELQRDLVCRSSNSKQIIAQNSGHMIPDEQPEIIVDAVREMIGNYMNLRKPSKQDLQHLIDAAARDEKVRKQLRAEGAFDPPGYHEQMQAVHDENALLLEKFLDQFGWPYPDEFDIQAHEAAWFIAIHAIAHPAFIKKVAQMLESAWKEGKISGKYYANFYDRIALYEGRKQRYGTHLAPSKHGWQPMPLEDPEHVDARRAEMGLPPLAEWIQESEEYETGFTDVDQEPLEREFEQWCRKVGWRK